MPEQWNNFFVMVGGGAAALAGLIFVAMSINHEIIFRNTTHKNRAINMLTGFTAIFMASSLALIGNQSLEVLGFEWLVLWLIATFIFVRGYVIAIRSGMSSIGLNPAAAFRPCPVVCCLLLFISPNRLRGFTFCPRRTRLASGKGFSPSDASFASGPIWNT